ncbi:MAG: D-alanyl-D-alanine carboxypeptidase [Actinomycetota bacterium]|nr:D-alanyl-D-alanine carboxypeptidase [Actinomycetota bacterium]
MRRLLGTVMAVLVAMSGVVATVPAHAAPDPQVDLLLHKRLDNPRLGDDVGMIVVDAVTGEVISAEDPDTLMLPASNMKIVTAVAILATMGADARLTTRVLGTPTPGELVLQGGGDPMLTSTDLQSMAKIAAAAVPAGTKAIVRVDDDLFPDTGRAPGWTSQYIPYVAAPVQALARLGEYSTDPSTNAARAFAKYLRSFGVKAAVGEPVDADASWPVLAESRSTVGEAVDLMLSRSENNVAEVLFRQVAVHFGIEPTWAGARQAVEQALAALGLDASAMRIRDGSGLSRKDRLSARFLADVLRVVRVTRPAAFAGMFDPEALPVSGETGTLHTAYGRYVTRHTTCARGDVHAKTGSLFDTIALSGIAATTTGGERIFSILVNDRPQRYSALSTRQAVDGLTATITGCWD